MQFTSLYPPLSIFGEYSKKWYIIADGTWHEVGRKYDWPELSKMWVKKSQTRLEIPSKKSKPKEWFVDGSKGNKYLVKEFKGVWSCSCPAHGFGRGKDCKHITNIKQSIK